MSASTPLLGLRGFPPSGRFLWRAGAVFVATGMLTGAFGSHGLKKREGMTADKVSSFMTASHYAIFNGLGLMLVSAHPRFASHRFAGPAIALGGFIFSSSIWGLIVDRERFKFLGPITPMGGMLAIIGYLTLAF